jgi:fructose-1,6-bisphosphatase/inositol monophosphatase family enzyme
VHDAGRRLSRAQPGVAWTLKPDGSFVTALDRAVEDRLRTRLLKRFPDAVFIGEEGSPEARPVPAGRPRIILDPIDGTAAFARGLNFFAISLAVFDGSGEPALAILHLPGMRRWYVARGRVLYTVGAGLRPTLRPRRRRRHTPLRDLRPSYVYLGSDPHLALDLTAWPGKTRALGATASHLGLLLDDTIDPVAAIVTRYKIWDVAAGLILAEAAGLDVRDLERPQSTLRVGALLDRARLPPLLVGRPDVVRRLVRAVRLIPPHARTARTPSRRRRRPGPSTQ